MNPEYDELEFEFIPDVSTKGTSLKYIHFVDENIRLSDAQKEILKKIFKLFSNVAQN